jgi:hypothetical protein
MKFIYKIIFAFVIILSGSNINAQNPAAQSDSAQGSIMKVDQLNPDGLADAGVLYDNGKIYIVVLVLLTIFAGIIFYLIRLEIKLNKLEKKQN